MSSGTVPEEIDGGEEPVDDLDEALEVTPYVYSITAYGADYPVDSLVKRINDDAIMVPRFDLTTDEGSEIVGFQREYRRRESSALRKSGSRSITASWYAYSRSSTTTPPGGDSTAIARGVSRTWR